MKGYDSCVGNLGCDTTNGILFCKKQQLAFGKKIGECGSFELL